MNDFLLVGIILFIGFVLGQEFKRFKLPKILGYLLAGVLLNPGICKFIPQTIVKSTDLIENIAIAFIAFAIGGTINFKELQKKGKQLVTITIFEAEITFIVITLGFIAVLPFITHIQGAGWLSTFIPAAILLGCLGSPTDPSVALAVTHQYSTKGEVTQTILGVSAFDDVLGIINYSVAVVIAKTLISGASFSFSAAFLTPLLIITGSIALGIVLGLLFNLITYRIQKQTEGVFFVVILSFLTLCWGLAELVHCEEILSVMVMAIVVTNYNPVRQKVFAMLERYSEELVFLIFFVLSGMHLDFKVMSTAMVLLTFFVVFRAIGKFSGVAIGCSFSKASDNLKKYTGIGLIPYGGIVIGLALIMQQDPVLGKVSHLLVSVIVGATIVNEFIGPILVKRALKGSKEIP